MISWFSVAVRNDVIFRRGHPNVAEILATTPAVIPAKAGIYLLGNSVDSRLRGNDRRS